MNKGSSRWGGMRWSRRAAERMLVLRAAVMAETFDTFWAAAAN